MNRKNSAQDFLAPPEPRSESDLSSTTDDLATGIPYTKRPHRLMRTNDPPSNIPHGKHGLAAGGHSGKAVKMKDGARTPEVRPPPPVKRRT